MPPEITDFIIIIGLGGLGGIFSLLWQDVLRLPHFEKRPITLRELITRATMGVFAAGAFWGFNLALDANVIIAWIIAVFAGLFAPSVLISIAI